MKFNKITNENLNKNVENDNKIIKICQILYFKNNKICYMM